MWLLHLIDDIVNFQVISRNPVNWFLFIPSCSSNDMNLVSINQPHSNNWVSGQSLLLFFFFNSYNKTQKTLRLGSPYHSMTAFDMHAKLLQLCPILCGPVDCSLPGSSVHRILEPRVLEGVAIPSSRGSSWPRDWIMYLASPTLVGGFFTTSATSVNLPYFLIHVLSLNS